MVTTTCRSCGRNIASGTIRCTKCGTPFHLSCSHRYKISNEGVFNICCGDSNNAFPSTSGTGYQMRTRRNKRRQPEEQEQQQNLAVNQQQQQENQIASTSKIQKLEPGKMGVQQKPAIAQDEPNNRLETVQRDFTEDNYDDNLIEVQSNDSITILDNDESNETSFQANTFNVNEAQIKHNITLETVWEGISSLQSSISNISNSLDTVSTHLNTFDPRINELETTLNTIKNKTTNFENVQNDVSGLKEDLARITNELEGLKAAQTEKSASMGEILSEMKEREMKSKNILIYNVPEDNLRISQDYSTLQDIDKFNSLVAARDTSRAREILNGVPNINLNQIIIRRLGRMRPNFCRPLRVTFLDKADVITVMKNKARISNQYSVKTDLTRLQQRRIKELKEELEKINVDQDNPTMTIKFINGEPQLIPVGQRYFKNE